MFASFWFVLPNCLLWNRKFKHPFLPSLPAARSLLGCWYHPGLAFSQHEWLQRIPVTYRKCAKTPGKWTVGTWKSPNWKGKSSEPNLHFWLQNVNFPGCNELRYFQKHLPGTSESFLNFQLIPGVGPGLSTSHIWLLYKGLPGRQYQEVIWHDISKILKQRTSALRIIGPSKLAILRTLPLRHTGSFTLPLEGLERPLGWLFF